MIVLGMDIGGTHIRIGLVGEDFRLLYPCDVVSSSRICSKKGVIYELTRLICEYLGKYPGNEPDVISIGVPASVSSDCRFVYCAPNLFDENQEHIMENIDLAEGLEGNLKIPVIVNKDVNNLLYYDIADTKLQGLTVGCYIGTGIGGAVIDRGTLLLGRHGYAMDIGHLPLYHVEKMCGCGKKGCAETIASGTAFIEMCHQHFASIPLDQIFVQCSDSKAVCAYIENCAYVIATLLTVFDPDNLVLGGGILEMDSFPRTLLESNVKKLTERAIAKHFPKVTYTEKLAERGVIGAAYFAAQQKKGDDF